MRRRLSHACPSCGADALDHVSISHLGGEARLDNTPRCTRCSFRVTKLNQVWVPITERPTREQLHMETALKWAERSTCKQPDRQVGVVITPPTMDEIISFGYNGPSRSRPNDSCAAAFGPGLTMTTASRCMCLHAEINAMLKATRPLVGTYLFVTLAPCFMCAQAIDQVQIAKVFFLNKYRNEEGVELLRSSGIEVEQLALS